MEKKTLGIVSLAMIALIGVSFVSAFGFGNGFSIGLTDEQKVGMQEQHEKISAAIESGDYVTWEGLMQEKLAFMEDRINEETFNQLVERHSERASFRIAVQAARESGDWSEVGTLRIELGLPERGAGFGKGGMQGQGMRGARQGNCLGLTE